MPLTDKQKEEKFIKDIIKGADTRYAKKGEVVAGNGGGSSASYTINSTPIQKIDDATLNAKISSAVANAIANRTVHESGAVEYKWNMTVPSKRGSISKLDTNIEGKQLVSYMSGKELLVTKKSNKELNIIGGFKSIVDDTNPFGDGSLVAKYQFENNANDLLDNHNGDARNIAYINGEFGKAVDFSQNDNSQILIPYKDDNQKIENVRTISAFINPQNDKTGAIISFDHRANSYSSFNIDIVNNLKARFAITDNNSGNNWKTVTSSLALEPNKFNHIVIKTTGSFEENNGYEIYINGVKDTNLSLNVDNSYSKPTQENGYSCIGSYARDLNAGESIYSGNLIIDQLEIYNRVLTEQEIQALYTQTMRSFNEQTTLTIPNNIVDIATTPDGGRLAVLTDTNIVTYDLINSQYELQQTIPNIGTKDCISMDFTGQTIVASGSDGIDKYDLSNQGNWIKTNLSTDSIVASYITADGEELYVYNTKLQVASKPFTTFTDVDIDTPKPCTDIHLTLDKQVMYLGNREDDSVANKNGVVHRYVKNGGVVSIVNSTDPFGDDSLVAKYTFEDNVNDLLGNHNGEIVGTITYEDGKFGKAIRIDRPSGNSGNNAIKILGDVSATKTISVWFNVKVEDSNAFYCILGSKVINTDNNNIILAVWDGKLCNYNGNSLNTKITFMDNIENNKWYHAVIMEKSNGKRDLYVDGVLIKQDFTDDNSTMELYYIGSDNGDGNVDETFNGLIDQVELYNRPLTQEEVNVLYTQGVNNPNKFILQESITSGNTTENFEFGSDISTSFVGDKLFIASKNNIQEYKVGE